MKVPNAGLPRGDEYVAALQHPTVAFRDFDLRGASIETRPNGLPRPYSGGFTMTFHAAGANGEWAIRCFTRDVRELARRYDAIGRFTGSTSDPAFVRAELIADEILVSGRRQPVIKMEWIRAPQLNAYVDRNYTDAAKMASLAEEILALGMRLEASGIAHGDLQHGNVLVTPIGRARLVDYDDLFLPELADLQYSSGLGHQNFQHPGRTSGDFGPHMDRFSLYVIYVSLLALARDPKLWEVYEGGDERLLFRREDYADPEGSKIFADLVAREAISEWIHRLVAVCHGPYAAIPAPEDFMAGSFTYARYVPGGPRPQPVAVLPPAPLPPLAELLPEPQVVAAVTPRPLAAKVGPALRGFDFVTPAIVIVVLALAAIFHDAILHFAFPSPPPPQTDSADLPEARGAAAHPGHPRIAAHARPHAPAQRAESGSPGATAATEAAGAQTAPPAQAAAQPAQTPEARVAHAKPVPARPHAARVASVEHAAADAAPAASAPHASHHATDATTGLLDAAAGDVAGTPKCSLPDAPARVVSGAVPVVSKYGGAVSAGGAADVAVSLTATGQVAGASIASSSGSADLDAAALDAARRSNYSPEVLNCSRVASSVNLHVRF